MKDHLKVPEKSGEEAIRMLKNSGILDPEFSILHEGGFLFIPLASNPENVDSKWEIVRLEGVARAKRNYPVRISGSYDVIGHIAISKERNEEKLRNLAADLMKSGKGIRSVYFDRGVKGDARIRDLMLIAGEDAPVAMYRENGIILKVDVKKVYFSPRLATERLLLSTKVSDGERIVDMFAGVGSFALNIASRKNTNITAIDNNPNAVSLMQENIGMNRLLGKITPLMADSSKAIIDYHDVDRIIMNLPHGAYSFIKPALGSLREGGKLNYYEICDFERLLDRLEEFRRIGLIMAEKREVHAYSSKERMYSVELVKRKLA